MRKNRKNTKFDEKKLIENTYEILTSFGEKTNKLLICVKCDMDNEMNFTDTRIAFDGEKIFILLHQIALAPLCKEKRNA